MSKKVLIISDGKPGHLNQSIAFCKIKNIEYDILEISFKLKLYKLLSYILDQVDLYSLDFFDFTTKDFSKYNAFVSTGSNTYYFNKVIAKKYHKKSIVLMFPKSYKLATFDYIIAQKHDNPPKLGNIITLPLNLSFNDPKGVFKQDQNKKSIGIIIGGDNDIFTMDIERIREFLDMIFSKYKPYLKYITTSRRTPQKIEKLILEYNFDYQVIYSKTPQINPISDFINHCEEIFVTIDSTSMLSEVRANSYGKVHIIDLKSDNKDTKFHKLAHNIMKIDSKVDFQEYLQKVEI